MLVKLENFKPNGSLSEPYNQCKAALHLAWKPIADQILSEEEFLNPDMILERMKESLKNGEFLNAVKGKYKSAIVDEFQETDAIQWEIFQNLFSDVQALYLVGDPKQSIYRFRNADVYTYLKAKDFLGPDNVYHLDTNYRSSPQLVSALNALFSNRSIPLPNTNS